MTVRFGSWRKKTRKFDRWRSASPNDTCFVVTGKGDAAQGWHLVLAELGSVADTGPMGVVRPGREQCDRHKLTALEGDCLARPFVGQHAGVLHRVSGHLAGEVDDDAVEVAVLTDAEIDDLRGRLYVASHLYG